MHIYICIHTHSYIYIYLHTGFLNWLRKSDDNLMIVLKSLINQNLSKLPGFQFSEKSRIYGACIFQRALHFKNSQLPVWRRKSYPLMSYILCVL